MKLSSIFSRAGLSVLALAVCSAVAVADMTFSTGAHFLPGPRMIDGSDLNVMVDQVNGISGGTTAGDFLVEDFIKPRVTDSATIGTSTLMFSDLFLASGAVINFNNGNVTVTHAAGTLTNSGSLTNTGGLAPAGGFTASCRNFAVGGLVPAVSSDFTNSTPVNTEAYVGEVFVPANCTATGVAVFNGSDVTDNIKVGLYSSAGALLAQSASTAGAGPDAYQLVPFTGTYALVGPATYYIVGTYAAGTSRYNAPPLGAFGCGKLTGLVFGTLPPTMTPPTTFTANLCNIASLY